jgi:curved DNA-binding protein
MASDYYETLGVSRSADGDEIQRAYRKLARTWHPDVNKSPQAEEKFKLISEAYDVLSNPDTRARYDAFGEDFRKVPDDVDPAAWARAQQGPRRGRSGPGPDPFTGRGGFGGSGDGASFEDLFGDLFAQRQSGPRPGPDQEVHIDLSLRDAYRGTKQKISLTGSAGPKNLTVTIPAGVTDGQRIRLAGQGAPGRDGGRPGDLYLIVRLRPDKTFTVKGRTITVDLPVTPWEAALGASVAVDTPDGGDAKVKVPAGTSSGKTLRLRGLGMPNSNGADGDLHAVVQIMVPATLTEREQELFAELAAASSFNPRTSS